MAERPYPPTSITQHTLWTALTGDAPPLPLPPIPIAHAALDSRDIRSGMALVAAALVAEGESTILEIETVERGYENLVERLRGLGADVVRGGA